MFCVIFWGKDFCIFGEYAKKCNAMVLGICAGILASIAQFRIFVGSESFAFLFRFIFGHLPFYGECNNDLTHCRLLPQNLWGIFFRLFFFCSFFFGNSWFLFVGSIQNCAHVCVYMIMQKQKKKTKIKEIKAIWVESRFACYPIMA